MLVNGAGQPVQLRGVSLSALEFVAVDGFDPGDPTGGQFGQPNNPDWAAIQSWKANVVRIPLNEASWLGLTCTDIDGNTKNADPGSNYKTAVASLVQEANAAGLYVILDLHWSAPGTVCPEGAIQMADTDHSLAFWSSIAATYQSNPAVMFELFNEPFFNEDFSGNPWQYMMQGTGGALTGFPEAGPGTGPSPPPNPVSEDVQISWNAASYQQMINTVRATGATNVVLVGAVSYSEDMSEWLQYRPSDPAGQLAAAWHAYPTYGYAWENPCTGGDLYCTPNFSPQIFGEVQNIQAAGIPVVVTETGDQNSTGTVGAPLVSTMTQFVDANGIGLLGWTWSVFPEPSSVLIQNASGTPTDGYGQFFQSWMVNHAP